MTIEATHVAGLDSLEWFECGQHGPTDNVARVVRARLVPLAQWFGAHALPVPGAPFEPLGLGVLSPSVRSADPPPIRISCPEDAAAAWGEESEMHQWARGWFARQQPAGPIEFVRSAKPDE